MTAAAKKRTVEEQLIDEMALCSRDPLRFVFFAFPWGSGELADYSGPDEWQVRVLTDLRDGILTINQAIQVAVASGHGIGKSALVAWIILWAMSTFEDTRGVVTANTETQLRTKTWAELAKWHRLCITRHWFVFTATAIFSASKKHEKTWRVDCVPWSEQNTEAFAGLHNKGKRVLLVFDEASSIPDAIWEVAEGALTDQNTQIIWTVLGNPTRPAGRFHSCFNRLKHRWRHVQIDSRSARMTNKAQLQKWIDDYGDDSDFVRIRVKGEFPRAGSNQFISADDVGKCRKYKAQGFETLPKVLSLDVARFGDDQSVPGLRQGRKFQILTKWRGLDTVEVAERFIKLIIEHNPDAIVIDGDGIGAGVIDQIRHRGYDRKNGRNILYEFHGGESAIDPTMYFNRRAEAWGLGRDALRAGMEISDDPELEQDLTGPLYGFSAKQQIQLERKEDMKKRGLSSPDCGDCFAMSFSVQIAARKPAERPKTSYFRDQGAGWMGA